MIQRTTRRTVVPPAALLLAALLILPACGGGEDEEAREAATPAADAPRPQAELPVPAVADTADTVATAAAAPDDTVPAPPAVEIPPEPAAEATPSPARVPAVKTAPGAAAAAYSLQLGSFRTADRADRLAGRLRAGGRPAVVETAVVDGATWHRVLLHGMADRDEARSVGEDLRAEYGIEYLIRRRP